MKEHIKNKKPVFQAFCVARKERFELSHRLPQSTPLAGEPLIATWVLPQKYKNGGDGRIRTHGHVNVNGFQDRLLKPLGHISIQRRLPRHRGC